MHRLFFLLFFSASLAANSSPDKDPLNGGSGTTRTTFLYGYTWFRPYALNDRFGLNGDNQFSQLATYGIGGITGSLVINAGYHVDAAAHLMFYRPREVASSLDSSVLQVRGWELMTSLYGYDVLKKVRAVDLVIGPGVYWGSVKLKRTANAHPNLLMRYKNPFVAPALRFDLRFNFWRFSIGARASYRYDITNSKWKERDGDLLDMPGYRFRDAQYVVYIGINFIDRENRPVRQSDKGDGENFD